MTERTFEFGRGFQLTVVPKSLARRPDTSTEVRSLADLVITGNGGNLTQGFFSADRARFESVADIPLVDLAGWLADSWDSLVYQTTLPRSLRSPEIQTLAERWALFNERMGDAPPPDDLYEWASRHAWEFAATDYSIPNVVFRRIDDFIEISWFGHSSPSPGNDVVFDHAPGVALAEVEQFTNVMRSFIQFVCDCCEGVSDDPRLDTCRNLLQDDGAVSRGRAALSAWRTGWETLVEVSDSVLESLGNVGTSTMPAIGFLRSAAGTSLTPAKIKLIFRQLQRLDSNDCRAELRELGEGLDGSINPERPWDSGIRLGAQVRSRLVAGVDTRVDVSAELDSIGVKLDAFDLGSPDFEGACFLTEEGRALAMVNPQGRLSRTKTGRSTTLAHELCHLLFDSRRGSSLGQLDFRTGMAGGANSLLEKRANAFAAELLLPRRAVAARAHRNVLSKDAADWLCRHYQVSRWVVNHQAQNQGFDVY